MSLVSSKLDAQKLNSMAKEMLKGDAKLEMQQEMMQDVLDSIGESMDDPEEQQALYEQVLGEVGLKVDDILPNSKKGELNKPEEEANKKVAVGADDNLDEMLKSLQK